MKPIKPGQPPSTGLLWRIRARVCGVWAVIRSQLVCHLQSWVEEAVDLINQHQFLAGIAVGCGGLIGLPHIVSGLTPLSHQLSVQAIYRESGRGHRS